MFIPAAIAAIGTLATAGTATAAGAAALSTAGTALGTAASVGGALVSGIAAHQQGQYQSAVAKNNARLAGQMAERERATADQAGMEQDMRNRAVGGQIRAQQGASGFDMGSGSLADVQNSQWELGRLDTLRKREGHEMAAWRYEAQMAQQSDAADLATRQGEFGLTSGLIGAAGSLMGGAGSFAKKWQTYNAAGFTSQWGA